MIYMHVVVPDFLNINGALTCKTQLRQCQLVLLVCPAKSNWWCSRLYGLLNKQICHFAKLLRCTIALLNRIWIWSALDLLINQDVSTKDISGFKQTGRENVVQGKREKRTWPRCAQCWWQMLLSFQTDFLLFFHFLPCPCCHLFGRGANAIWLTKEYPVAKKSDFVKHFWESLTEA